MFKGKSTGIYGFYNQTHGCPVNDPSNSSEWNMENKPMAALPMASNWFVEKLD